MKMKLYMSLHVVEPLYSLLSVFSNAINTLHIDSTLCIDVLICNY
jgi:hypothetical protein